MCLSYIYKYNNLSKEKKKNFLLLFQNQIK